ncbi:MAG: DNA repair protein RecO [Ruminococcus sp.]|nr:DNA repair protein RecO [Candidatus Apopatosoma intestinale]
MEPVKVMGLVLRETPVGESDRMMTVLTAEYGRISVYGRGARGLKNAMFVSTQLFCYSEFVIVKTGETYTARECSLADNFYHLRDTLPGLALASYIAEVAADIASDQREQGDLLRLTLNSLYAIAWQKKPLSLIKAVFELRSLAGAGFMPDLVGCAGCGKYQFSTYYLDIPEGTFRCEDCFHKNSGEMETELRKENEAEGIYSAAHLIVPIAPEVFVAMRYAVYSRPERLFSFDLPQDALSDFASVCEKYLLCHLDREFRTLDFYHSVI